MEETLKRINPYKVHIRVTCGSRAKKKRIKFAEGIGEVKAELERLGMTVKPKNTKMVKIVVVPDNVIDPGKTNGKYVVKLTPFRDWLRANPQSPEVEKIVLAEDGDEPLVVEKRNIFEEASKNVKSEPVGDESGILERWTNEVKGKLI